MARDHTFIVRDSDAEMDGKPHAVVMTNYDGSRSHVWDLSDAELVALYRAVARGQRVQDAQYRAEATGNQIYNGRLYCGECGADVPRGSELIGPWHADSCSLHPSAIVDNSGMRQALGVCFGHGPVGGEAVYCDGRCNPDHS